MVYEHKIPYELHITTGPLPVSEISNFVSFCTRNEAKPLLIELARGEFIRQPMFNKILRLGSLEEALIKATEFSSQLKAENFNVQRLKIEIPSDCSDVWSKEEHDFDGLGQ